MRKGVLRTVESGRHSFWCPGCNSYHMIGDKWTFNGDYKKPTFAPSILVKSGHYADGHPSDCWCNYEERTGRAPLFSCYQCHLFITNGKLQYLQDCTHALAGKTIDMVDSVEVYRKKP